MKESDQLATSFITPFGTFCYVTMPFGLRNAGATYQRCMQHVFGDHIGRTVEAYVDDIVVKTRKADDLVDDLAVAFGCLRANGVKLNPEKCVFGVPRGMLLGYIVSQRGIEAHPVTVVSSFPLGEIIRNPDAAGRIAKWSVELMGETLAYAPRKAIKSQILADFVAEWTDTQLPPPTNPGRVLDSVLRRLSDENGSRRGPALRVTPRGAHALRSAPPLPRVQQYG
jgi:hypothetical protein